jgi:class 3 adenylate cyclase
MEIKKVFLVLADISGYTGFMRTHQANDLIHAETIITELLEAVIDASQFPLTLSKLEGDAAFLYATFADDSQAPAAAQEILRQVTAFFNAFRAKERALIACSACRCEACDNIAELKLKAFLHVGEAAIKKIRQFEELAGQDVILIHRLLKNTVVAKEYILLTEPFYALSGGLGDSPLERRTEDAEGFNPVAVRVYYPAGDSAPLPPRPAPDQMTSDMLAWGERMVNYTLKRTLGRVEPHFNHLPNVKLNPASDVGLFAKMIFGKIMIPVWRWRLLSQKPAVGK